VKKILLVCLMCLPCLVVAQTQKETLWDFYSPAAKEVVNLYKKATVDSTFDWKNLAIKCDSAITKNGLESIDSDWFTVLGVIYYKAGRKEEALAAFKSVLLFDWGNKLASSIIPAIESSMMFDVLEK